MTNCGKPVNIWDYQAILPVSREIHIWVKKQQLEIYMEQWTGSFKKKRLKEAKMVSEEALQIAEKREVIGK